MNKIIYTLFFLVIFLGKNIHAQNLQRLDIELEMDGELLNNPFVGGLNSPQFSEVDLNNDGIQDLLLFDKAGNVHLTFINDGSTEGQAYHFAPEYALNFPKLNQWVLLRDFDGDGIMDIFSYPNQVNFPGIVVFKGKYELGKISFEPFPIPNLENNLLVFLKDNNLFEAIQVSENDIPAIDDIDGDGDLDILTYNGGGTYVEYFQNQSIENGFGKDSLQFVRADACWGKFKEGVFDANILLSNDVNICAEQLVGTTVEVRHPGSTLMTIDADNDGDKDLIMGDVTSPTLTFLQNGGDSQQAFMDSIDMEFPSYGELIKMKLFLGTYHLDVDNDGIKDLIITPNETNFSQDHNQILFYKNTGSNEFPYFEFQQNDFLVKEMLDLGTGANPTFVDVNADGLLDLVVGNINKYVSSIERDSRLFYFKNIGTLDVPKYRLEGEDYLNLKQYNSVENYFNFSPSFGDLDGDGDLDLIVGEQTGKLIYFENIAGVGQPLSFATPVLNYKNLDLGTGVNPQIIDVNKDGLQDLLVGHDNGSLFFLPNIGTLNSPDFASNPFEFPNQFSFGNVSTKVASDFYGSSSPLLLEQNDEYILFVGSARGGIYVFKNIDNNLDGDFFMEETNFGQIVEGRITHLDAADINNDGHLDFVIGNSRGGLNFYASDGIVPISKVQNQLEINIFPNPISKYVSFEMQANQDESVDLQIFSSIGNVVLEKQLRNKTTTINVSQFSAGIYFCRFKIGATQILEKLIIF